MNIVVVPGSVNNSSEAEAGAQNRTSQSCQNQMLDKYSSGSTYQQQSSLYTVDPLAMTSNNQKDRANGISYAKRYGIEGGACGGIDSYNELESSAGNEGGIQNTTASAAATINGNSSSDKAAYELLDREMQYILKFADPDSNLAAMDELIQSGVDLLDLLPPEEGGVKPRFSNPSNDWKYDIIAKSVDACNPVSECTCHHYDGRRHDIHLCSVHHDTVSQDSDTLTMDTEGSLVHIPTIKLHSTCMEVKCDLKNNATTTTATKVSDDAGSINQTQQHFESDFTEESAQCQKAFRTGADNNKGGNIVGYDASGKQQGQPLYDKDSSVSKSGERAADMENQTYEYHGTNIATNTVHSDGSVEDGSDPTGYVNKADVHLELDARNTSVSMETTGEGQHDEESVGAQGEGHDTSVEHEGHESEKQNVDNKSENSFRNSTVFAEVHVDATAMKYDEPTALEVDNTCRRKGEDQTVTQYNQSEGQDKSGSEICHFDNQSVLTTQEASGESHDAVNENVPPCSSLYGGKDKPTSPTNGKNTISFYRTSDPLQPGSDTSQGNTTTTTHPENPDPASSSPATRDEPSTSRHKENYEVFLSRPTSTTVEDHRKKAFKKRPSLPIEPRTTQYQKHALLQERSDTGVLELELLLAERMEEEEQLLVPRESLSNRKCSLDSSRLKLVPRMNQYEQHALLRKTNSGMSEIEELLQEKEQEFIRKMNEKRDSTGNISRSDSKKFMLHRGSLGRLEPRLGQYEKHPLLQSKDEDGRMALEMFLEEELTERKANMADLDASGNNNREKLAQRKSNTSDTSSNKGSVKKSRSKSSSLKKVHFERGGSSNKKKPEEPESGISSKGEASSTSDPKQEGQGEGHEVDNGYDTYDDDKTEEDRLTGETAKAKLNKDQRKCCTIS